MVKLSKDDVLRLAQLARLELTESEINEFAPELNQILEYVAQLQSIDTTNLEPTNQVTGLTNVSRDDLIKDYGYEPRELLKNVPKVVEDQIQVKRMVE